MKLKIGIVLAVAISAAFLSINSVFSEDQTTSSSAPSAEASSTQEPQWVWAEVLSVDPVIRQMNVKYLDYETDTEKEMVVNADDNTTYENVKSLAEIKPQDTVSIDYVAVAEGKNIAKNINVEKPEAIQPVAEEAAQAAPPVATEAQETNPSDQQSTPSQGQE